MVKRQEGVRTGCKRGLRKEGPEWGAKPLDLKPQCFGLPSAAGPASPLGVCGGFPSPSPGRLPAPASRPRRRARSTRLSVSARVPRPPRPTSRPPASREQARAGGAAARALPPRLPLAGLRSLSPPGPEGAGRGFRGPAPCGPPAGESELRGRRGPERRAGSAELSSAACGGPGGECAPAGIRRALQLRLPPSVRPARRKGSWNPHPSWVRACDSVCRPAGCQALVGAAVAPRRRRKRRRWGGGKRRTGS